MTTSLRRLLFSCLATTPLAIVVCTGCNAIPKSAMQPPELAQTTPIPPGQPAPQNPNMPRASAPAMPVNGAMNMNGFPGGQPGAMGNSSAAGAGGHVHGPGCGPHCNSTVTPANPAFPNQCVVVMRDGDGKSERVNINLDGESHVQEMLVRSGAWKRFRRMEVQLIRTSPNGQKHRMGVHYDVASRQVKTESDYFVQPGDVIVVTQDQSTFIDDMLGRTQKGGGPLSVLMSRR